MNLIKVFLLIFALILSFNRIVAAQNTDRQIEKVIEVLKTYDTAWNKKDTAKVGEILATDYIYFTSTGSVSTRQATLDFLVSPKYVLTFVERSEIKAIRSGSTVIVSSRWKGKGSYEQGEINDDQRCGMVFVKTGKKWKLLSEHCTQITFE